MDYQNPNNSNSDLKLLAKSVFDSLQKGLKKQIGVVLLVPLILVGVLAINYYYQYQVFKNNPQQAIAKDNRELVAVVSKLIILPEGEEPTVATVSDPNVLKDQPFFQKAQLGDKVLIYNVAQKAVLYRPSVNKIIEMAPLNTSSPTPPPIPEINPVK